MTAFFLFRFLSHAFGAPCVEICCIDQLHLRIVASDTWNRIVSGEYSAEDKGMKIQALKDYCHLDTLAMVEIWKVLKGSIL